MHKYSKNRPYDSFGTQGNCISREKIVEQVEKYKYLGHEIRVNRDNRTQEQQRRISLGWTAYGNLRNVS